MRTNTTVSGIYVSCDSEKCYNGISPETPLRTLGQAITAVEELRGAGARQPITIYMKGGVYELDRRLEITPPVSDITIKPYPGEKVVISGGRRLSGFTDAEFNGHACFGLRIPEVESGKLYFTDLYVDGKRANITRYPESGELSLRDAEPTNPERRHNIGSSWFYTDADKLLEFRNLSDVRFVLCHYWVDEHVPLESVDTETGKVTLKYKTSYDITNPDPKDNGFYFENVAEGFRNPGDWYLDRASGMLYYIPENDTQTPDSIEVIMPVLPKLIQISRDKKSKTPVREIHFHDIVFAHTRGDYPAGVGILGDAMKSPVGAFGQGAAFADGVVTLYGAEECSFDGCSFLNYGLYGIDFRDGCIHNSVSRCLFRDGGVGGVKINGADSGGDIRDRTGYITVSDCVMKKLGQRVFSGTGVMLMNAFGNLISHNEISDMYYSAIAAGWVWGYADSVSRDNIIEKNHIFNIGQKRLSDMGGVYLLGPQPGTTVRGNLIHDIYSRTYGGWGIYTDEGSTGILIENNICYNFSENCYHQHYGSSNIVRNNIFAFAGVELARVSRQERHFCIAFENNIFYSNGCPMYGMEYKGKPNNDFNIISSHYIELNNNIYFDSSRAAPVMIQTEGYEALSDFIKYGLDDGSGIADPGFRDAGAYDFSLPDGAEAIKEGFVPIDMADVGPRRGARD